MSNRSWDRAGVEVLRTNDFDAGRLKRPGTYAVCFGATWCWPTRGFIPKFVARSGCVPAQLAMADISELDDPLWDMFQIKITPTIVAFRNGLAVARFNGRRFLGLRDSDLDRLADQLAALGSPSPLAESSAA
ncbi:MAG: thioredoxin family protein [Thermoplasmata archaeon]|nr:thioredoxin family protein [Thermoplasmata archaeon]